MSPKGLITVVVITIVLTSKTGARSYDNKLREREPDLNNAVTATDLKCPPCSKIHCTPRKASKLKCKGGVTTGICSCCPACAKLEGEDCGGEWNYLGKCDVGLYCEAQKSPYPVYGTSSTNAVLNGKCRRSPRQVGDEGLPGYCHPKCTPKFCKENPREICSAMDVGEVKQHCQGECQHTSCQACRFADYEPDCDKCSKNDFECMKKFAKCVKRQYCTRNKFPCRKTAYKMEESGKFQCMVPSCS